MSEICTCGIAYGETGLDNCPVIGKTPHNVIIVPRYKADGTLNSIDSSSVTLGADILALTQYATTPQERLYPIAFGENFTMPITETVYATAPSGNKFKIKDGIRSVMFELWDKSASVRMLSELKKFGCSTLSYYLVDIEGKIEGYKNAAGDAEFYPFPMSTSTYNALLNYATDADVQKIMVSFDREQYFNDAKIYYLTQADLGYSATELKGLVPIGITATLPTTTSVTVTLTKPQYSAATSAPLVGLLAANFSIENTATNANVPVLTCTESSDGVYVLTYAAVTGTSTFEVTTTVTGYAVPVVSYIDPS
jgi:hypothetical protein